MKKKALAFCWVNLSNVRLVWRGMLTQMTVNFVCCDISPVITNGKIG